MKKIVLATVAAAALLLQGCSACGVCFPRYSLCTLPCGTPPQQNCQPAVYTTSGPSLSMQ